MTARKLHVGPDLTLPDDAVTQTFVIFGKRGSGKSNTGVVLAEEMHRAGGQIIILDPVGAWWGLKSSFDGSGPGLPVYIFGGTHGDLPLQPDKGQLMAQVAIAHRIPMVLDMSGWAGTERARFVTAFATWLLAHNDRTPVHVFLEEADAFIPQRPYKGEEAMLGAMDRLIRWGRAEGIGATAITQRSAKINKDVTTQAEVLIAHRTIGPQDVAAIREWIKFHSTGDEQQEILASLPTLPDGTAWVWSPDWLDLLRQVPFRRRETFDSASTPKLGEKRVQPKALAPVDVDALRDQLAATVEQAKANDPAELRRRIVALERQIASAPAAAPERVVETVVERVEVPVLTDRQVQALREAASEASAAASALENAANEILGKLDWLSTPRPAPVIPAPADIRPDRPGAVDRQGGKPDRERPEAPIGGTDRASVEPGEVRLDAGARRMLSALASLHPTPLSRIQLGTLTDLPAKGSTFRTYLSQLRSAGLIDQPDAAHVALSAAGVERMSDEIGGRVPTTAELVEMWGRKLDRGARQMLGALVEAYPEPLTREQLADVVEIPASGSTFRTYLSKIRSNQLIEEANGSIRAGEALFLGAR